MATASGTDFGFKLLKSLFGEETAHRLTGWQWYRIDPGENVPVYKERRKVKDAGRPPPRLHRHHQKATINSNGRQAGPPWEGSFYGHPIQNGATGRWRDLTWGYIEHGDVGAINPDFRTRIPLPASGKYTIEGGPNPGNTGSDRHCTIRSADDGSVHEMIQFDPFQPINPFLNQALNWAKYDKDGRFIAGSPVTAGGSVDRAIAIHKMLWTPWSAANPHRMGFATFDYHGGDGSMPEGTDILCGGLYYLPADSPSYTAMVARGGECAARARAANEYGLWCYDRSGYSDVGGHTTVGERPKGSGFCQQVAAQFNATNAHEFMITFTDLRFAVEA